ncbi:MAG: carboxypeptidase-like regulatory domain-containing protein [Candidatus Margulisiibacteriota bacterium]
MRSFLRFFLVLIAFILIAGTSYGYVVRFRACEGTTDWGAAFIVSSGDISKDMQEINNFDITNNSKGKVTSNIPIKDIVVTLKNKADLTPYSGSTNDNGWVRIDVPEGQYYVSVNTNNNKYYNCEFNHSPNANDYSYAVYLQKYSVPMQLKTKLKVKKISPVKIMLPVMKKKELKK